MTAKVGRSGVAVQQCPSPNHGERLGGPVDILLLHYTGMLDADQSLAWLTDPASRVSSHYFVFEDGRIVSLVEEEHRAWHAGASQWGGAADINSRSIGIEIANPGHPGGLPDFPDVQIDALIGLCREILDRRAIPSRRVLAHSDVSPGRKLDPGERFPWARLAAEGVGHWTGPRPPTDAAICARGNEGEHVATLQALLALYGYGIDVTGNFDHRTEDVVAAFQRHFRQERVDGRADRSTIETLRDLIEALP